MPGCHGMLGAAESSPGAPAEPRSPGREPGRAGVPAAPCPRAAAGLGIGQQPAKALCAFLSWQVKMWVNPWRGGPGDFPVEVKGANIPPPAAVQHLRGIQNAFRGQLSSSGVAVVGVPSACLSPGLACPLLPGWRRGATAEHAAHSSSRARSRECRQASPCAAGVWPAGTGLPAPP